MNKRGTVALVAALGLSFSTAGRAQSGAGYALNFDATDAFVEVAHVAELDAFPLTVTAWLNTTNRQNPSRLGVVNKYFASSANGYILLLDQGHIHAYYFRDSANYVFTPRTASMAAMSPTDYGTTSRSRWTVRVGTFMWMAL